MRLRVRLLDLDAGGKTVVIINPEDARELGLHALERVVVYNGKRKLTAIVNISDKVVLSGDIAIYDEIKTTLCLKDGDSVRVEARPELESKMFVRKRVDGQELCYKEIKTIVDDVVSRSLNDLEISSLVTALHMNPLTLNENYYFAKAFIETSGENIRFPGIVVDKHGCGGIPGDKTTIIVVPIIAAAGLTIPKTSSRAITDPAGTADRVEVVCPVKHDAKAIKSIVKKTHGCMVWGGSLKLAPADNLFIQIEKPLSMDPLIVPSVLAKKKVVGSRYVIIDIPCGPEAKVKTTEEAEKLAKKFIIVGKKLGIKVACVVTRADQPLGFTMGPALEAREALQALGNPHSAPKDLIDKVLSLSGMLLKMVKKGDRKTAEKLLFGGRAEKKFREIVKAQGGNMHVKPDMFSVEKNAKAIHVKADKNGYVSYISNRTLVGLAKMAGAPKDMYSGIVLKKKIGDRAKKGEILYTIFVERTQKTKDVLRRLKSGNGYVILNKMRKMVVEEINYVR